MKTIFQLLGALGAPALSASKLDRLPWLLLAVAAQLNGFSGLLFYPEAG